MPQQTEYDYIIVAAPARLSEDPGCRVLPREAGRDYRAAERPCELGIPNPRGVLYGELAQTYLWPGLQARCTEAQPPRFFWRGRGVGGSSSINGQIAIRGMLEAMTSGPRSAAKAGSAPRGCQAR